MTLRNLSIRTIVCGLTLILWGCGGSGPDITGSPGDTGGGGAVSSGGGSPGGGGGGGSGGAGSGDSAISLSVTDAPVDSASRVVVSFTGVSIKPASGDTLEFDFDEPRRIDLLALQGNESELILDNEPVEEGDYNWIRLGVIAECDTTDSFIELDDGSVFPLFVPSGSQTGLKLNKGFTVGPDGTSAFTIDFDLRKSVHKPNGRGCYFLKPVLRLVENAMVGSITGTVDPSLIVDETCTDGGVIDMGGAVYVYPGHGIEPDDIDEQDPEPFATANVALNAGTGDAEYTLGFLPAGDYTLAFTCQSADDDPETDDMIMFVQPADVGVQPGQSTIHDFVAP